MDGKGKERTAAPDAVADVNDGVPLRPGAKWTRTADFENDLDVNAAYETLRSVGSVTMSDEFEVAYIRIGAREGKAAQRRRKLMGRKFDALTRRAAEDGFSLQLDDTEWLYLCQPSIVRPGLFRQGFTTSFAGPLSEAEADPRRWLITEAGRLYSTLRGNGEAFHKWLYADEALLKSPDFVIIAELERLAAADGFELRCVRWDDIGEDLTLVTAGSEADRREAADPKRSQPTTTHAHPDAPTPAAPSTFTNLRRIPSRTRSNQVS